VIEREVKLRFGTANEARAALQAAGAAPLRGRRLQDDFLYDTADGTLRARRCALRVRRESGTTWLTFKGPVEAAPMKLRDEHESLVDDGEALTRVLEGLGYQVWFRYQKYREEFAGPDVVIALDETPVGTFVEIEGSADGIFAATRALGRTTDDFILDSYRALFVRHGAEAGLRGRDMLFPDAPSLDALVPEAPVPEAARADGARSPHAVSPR
jgi:adenylate cyclase class 2